MSRRFTALLALFALFSASIAHAQTLTVELELPSLNVAEYHRPYSALWIADDSKSVVANLAVLYDVDLKDQEGEKWLKDMRQWWRRSGRSLDMPIDGLSGATRGPGNHVFDFSDQMKSLSPGGYQLVVEVAREVGGRELVSIPFQWPPQQNQSQSAQGQEEIGAIELQLNP